MVETLPQYASSKLDESPAVEKCSTWSNQVCGSRDEFEYEEEEVNCHCGQRAVCRISHTSTNPNRKFFGCPNWSNRKGHNGCGYFEWLDIHIAVKQERESLLSIVNEWKLAVLVLKEENQKLKANMSRSILQPCMCICDGYVADLKLVKERLDQLEAVVYMQNPVRTRLK